ncbi:MAG TPA: glutamate mutase L, partial [Geobacteraceae bacterium]
MPSEIEILTIEVGSTITKVNGFALADGGGFDHVAQGFAPTSVAQGDVGIGVQQAIDDLESRYGASIGKPETFVNSSAAGGLRMTVHGLTYSMTARAAREASLGAGAIVKMVTAGPLDTFELEEIKAIHPNIILLSGGVDFGEKTVVLQNAERIASLKLPVPVVYAGNVALRKPIHHLFHEAGIELLLADNVFPDVDILNIEPLRHLIHDVFSRHIIHAPGMARFAEMTHWGILPTPGAVLKGAELFAEVMGDCLIFDVGGATTDVHSVTDGSMEFASKLVEPEPRAKRTVEGDLGVY